MGQGRKPDPPKLRALKGGKAEAKAKAKTAARKAKAAAALKAPARIPAPPPELDEEERGYFDLIVGRLVEEELASSSHTEVIAIAAKRMAEIVALSAEIKENGFTYWAESSSEDGAPLLKANPAVRMRSEAQRHLHSLLVELGLTPVAQSKVGAGVPKGKPDNPFARFLGAGR
ncbi:phage terminase small subunit P27 family [Vulgatibacter sp.]|uniref:phage terminase small subunit P27 family n=1 Tax=Vulgatibacter sp. TaxID=1971226 RepID=UPI0035699AD6